MSIFKEVSLTPQVFDKSRLFDNERKFEKLLNALESLSESGILVGVYSDWFKYVNQFISNYDDFDKDEIEAVLRHLDDRQRIVHGPEQFCDINNEQCWIDQALKLNRIRAFEIILTSQQSHETKSLDNIDRKTLRDAFQNKGAKVLPQSKKNMQKLLMPTLAYAEIAKIYDPYFNLSQQRYEDALDIVCQTLGSHHGIKKAAIIDVHTSTKSLLNNKILNWGLSNKWKTTIKNFQKQYGHEIVIHVWEDKKDNHWHDRWLITNQCAITLGKGSDVSEWTDATWGILDYDDIPNVESKFNLNRNEYTHVATINANGLMKDQRSKDEPKTEEEIETIRNRPTIITKSGYRKKQ